MINLINGYCVDVDPLNYTVKKRTGKVDKEGKDILRTYTYHGTLQGAVSKSLELIAKEELGNGEHSLVEALEIMQANQNKFEELMQQVIANFDPADVKEMEESEDE